MSYALIDIMPDEVFMQIINEQQLSHILTANRSMIVGDQELRVLRTKDEQVIKVFRRRKILTSGLWAPPAKRFQENAARLLTLGVCAPKVNQYLYCPQQHTHIILYPILPGQDLRALVAQRGIEALARLPMFLSHLHHLGIYFRAIHLGNILRINEEQLGLIDLSDLAFKSRSLRIWERGRNLAHLFNNRDDEDNLQQFGVSRFMKEYVVAAKLNEYDAKFLFLNMRWRLRSRRLRTDVKNGLTLAFISK